MSTFRRFAPRLQAAIVARLGWTSLRPVQEQAGAALLDGHNAVVLAPTAGGKTEAAMFPLLSRMVDEPPEGVAGLYIAPIKALLNNQAERLGTYTEMVGLRRFVWHGDTAAAARNRFLREPTDLLMTTPESLEVMLISPRVRVDRLFGDLRMVVVDEVHALAGTDRGAHLMSVLERIAAHSRHDVQRVGLSATVGNPRAILEWLTGTSRRPGVVVDSPAEPQRRQLLVVYRPDLAALGDDASAMAWGRKSLFFCQSRATAEAVAERVRRAGTTVYVHHSAVSREERAFAEEQFHRGTDACIVCTSTLELGIDVGDLDRVLQAEAPSTVGSFLQRMGRTGRRPGKAANTTFLCTSPDSVLQAAALIELARDRWVEDVPVQDRCWPVLVHQLLAMALAGEGVTREEAWQHLHGVPDFRGVHRPEFDRLVTWMLRDGGLEEVGGRLVLGRKAERRFGRRNFMDLYAVFSSPVTYTVSRSGGTPLGSLEQSFVDRLVEGVSCFLLGGRAWVPTRIAHDLRQVHVEPAPKGRKPTWGGYLPQFLGFEICQRVRDLLLRDDEPPFLHPTASEVLRRHRALFADVLRRGVRAVEYDDGEIRWWTFAGGRINNTLRYALQACHPDWKVVPDNFLLKVRGDEVRREAFEETLERLDDVEIWEDENLWADVAEDLPNYRLSKFQSLMPPWAVREMVAAFLLDLEGTWRWLSGGDRRLPLAPDLESVAPAEERPPPRPTAGAQPTLPIRWIRRSDELIALCDELARHDRIGLDVETTLRTRTLCLVQIATSDYVALIDALEVEDLSPLAEILSSERIVKVIHNASFEQNVLGRLGLTIRGVFDTLHASRTRRGRAKWRHDLGSVCSRELGLILDKSEQISDWSRRPLTDSQIRYAALDAEVLLRLHDVFARTPVRT